jgi:hypothetical protein
MAATSNPPSGEDVAADSPVMHFFSPPTANYTRIPNEFFDKILPEIKSLSELKVTLVIMRATFGYQESERLLTIDTLMERTGMARPSVVDGAKRAMERGYFGRRRVQKGYVYGARVKAESSGTSPAESKSPEPKKVQEPGGPSNKGKKQEKETLPVGENVEEKILAFWLALDPSKKPAEYKLTKKRKKAIDGRLADSSKQEIREALEGQWHDPWCQETGKLDLEYALRDRDHLEDFRDRRRKQVARSNGASSNGNGQAPTAHPEYNTTAPNMTRLTIRLIDDNGPLTANQIHSAIGTAPKGDLAATLESTRERLMQMVEDGDCVYEPSNVSSGEGTYGRPGAEAI